MRTSIAVSIVWVLLAACATAGEGKDKLRPGELKLTTERVIVFKDGYCLFVKRAVGTPDADGEVFTEEVPDAAVLGSFWAVPSKGRLLSMTAGVVTSTEEQKKQASCRQMIHVLKANKGKQAVVLLDEKTVVRGTIKDVLLRESTAAAVALPARNPWRYASAYSSSMRSRSMRSSGFLTETRRAAAVSGSFFVLGTAEGDMLLSASAVRRITVKDMVTTTEEKTIVTKRAKRLTFRVTGTGPKCEMLITYFRPGIRWIPTYRVELGSPKATKKLARIALQAVIINEAEDLQGVPLDLVVGVPNFRFKSAVSPFVLESVMRNALNQAMPGLRGRGFSNALMTQRIAARPRTAAPLAGGSVRLPSELTAAARQDLFVYSLPKLKLKKGHRAAVPIFNASAPYRDVYTWDLQLRQTHARASTAASPLVLSANRVWHQIELTNNTKVPWTTGAVMIMQGRQPLAQELLTYTSPGDSVRVPVTVSVDTRGRFSGKETGRKLKALHWLGYNYARIDKEGTLTVTNRKKVAVDLELTCRLGGKAEEASGGGKITTGGFQAGDWQSYYGSSAVNRHSSVVWRLRLEPGKSAERTVKYHYFVRH